MELLDHDTCYRALASRDARFDGRFFIAVKTTRIYCRPICPARTARSENVLFFPTAAAAQETGYRPCLRCRPEAAPDSSAWRGVSNTGVSHTVTRALGLIEMGALDEHGVEALAERLGVGDRQLRRLFAEHVGATPVAVAQTRRVLLAQQLIHETTLPLTEIAFAAGFGSVRRFNEVFQQLFKRPPTALRHSRQAEIATPEGEVTLLLRYRPPYDWPAMLRFLSDRAISGIEAVHEGHYLRSFAVDGPGGQRCLGTLKVAHRPAEQALQVTLRCNQLVVLPQLIARLRRVFDLAADPGVIAEQLSVDPLMARLCAARPGLRVPGAWDGFELAMRAVLGQQITVAAAVKLAAKLVDQYGDALPCASEDRPGLSRLFPTPAQLQGVDLARLGMPRSRGATLAVIVDAALSQPRLFEAAASLDEGVAALRALPGIGDWTAQYIAIRQLREPDAFPSSDVGLMQAIEKLEGQRPDARALLQRSQAWRPWRAYAAQQLWTALLGDLPVPATP
ncbi:AlkA N-terminal domain-containing protein [Paucibacter sp. APW11]|uniref:DNA-3-methyladenine glycosylase II n=1 Tax=Roseateles aquae TaxID=3077235 RepID=A0ABU3P968_9BURK|nr:AlkA N-terminal domain-containing protein [Paucibacter sp. APW11]MDT8998618.1 AlkA N-terminal domain-containing protein [Paucibacter sp. APW11]